VTAWDIQPDAVYSRYTRSDALVEALNEQLCGVVKAKLPLGVRVFECDACGGETRHWHDLHTAEKHLGLRSFTGPAGAASATEPPAA
jgi:hypothetical protein